MIQIAQANCQSPPIVDGSGKPVGCNLQPGNAENEFKEVLRKEKSKDDVDPIVEAAMLAGSSVAAMPVSETQPMRNLVEDVSDIFQEMVPDVSTTIPVVEESIYLNNGDAIEIPANNAKNMDMVNSVEIVSSRDVIYPLPIESAPAGQGQQIQQPFTQPGMIPQNEAVSQQAAPVLRQMPVNAEKEEGTPNVVSPISGGFAEPVISATTVEYQIGTPISIEFETAVVDESPNNGNQLEIRQMVIPIEQTQQKGETDSVETQPVQMGSSRGSKSWKSSLVTEPTSAKISINTDLPKVNPASEEPSIVEQQPDNSSEFVSETKISVIEEPEKSEQNLPELNLYQMVDLSTEKAADAGQADAQIKTKGKQGTKDESLSMNRENENKTVHSVQMRTTFETLEGSDNAEQLQVTMADKKSTPIPGVKSDNSSGAFEAEQINEASIAQGMEPARQEKAVSQNELERLILTDPELQGNSEVATTIGNEENKKTVQKSSSPDGSSAAIEKNETENSQKKQDFSASMPAVKMTEKSIGAASAYAQYASDIKGNDAVKFSLQEGGKQNKDLNGNIQTSQNPNKEKIATPAQPAKAQDLAGSVDTGVTGAQVFTSSLKQNVNLFPTLNNTSEVSTLHIQQIVKEVDQSLQAGKNVIHIQLHPENLGKIDIRLSSDASGLGINIIAENASTKRMLENQVDILKQSLNNAGLHLSQMNFGMKGQEGQYERQFYQNDPSNVSKNWFQKPWRESEVGKYNDTPQRRTLQLTTIDYQI